MPRSFGEKLLPAVVVVSLLAAGSMAFGQPREVSGLSVALQAERPEYRAADALTLRFTLTNTSGAAINVLTWQTPLEGFTSNMFRVQRDGAVLPYIGRMVKRRAPTPEDYITVGAGTSVSATIDLAEGYGIYEAGNYTVEFNSRLFDFGT